MMRTTEEIMRRKWAKDGKNYRVVTYYGNTMYSESKPILSYDSTLFGSWHCEKELFVFGEAVCEEWARENHKNSLQSFEDYQKLSNQQWPNQNQDKSE